MRIPVLGREALVALAIVAAAGIGAGLEAARGDVAEPAPSQMNSRLFVERATFCSSAPEGADATTHLTAGPIDEEPLLLDIEPGSEEPAEISQRIVRRAYRNPTNAQVISYGKFASAATSTVYRAPVPGVTAAPCSNSASRRWLFPAGSSSRGYNMQLVLYNPFPDEAVVRISFVTPNGVRSKANLSNVAIPSGGATTVKVNRFILQQPVLAADVSATRGRIVAWKTLFSNDDDRPKGVGGTVGSRAGSTDWYFPSGASGEGIEERMYLLNTTDEEAIVTMSLVGDESVEQPNELVEIEIPRRSSKSVAVSKALGAQDVGGVSAIVHSDNGVPIFAERAVWYSGAFKGFSLEVGSPLASASWWLGPAAVAPTQDSIVVLNVGQKEATVTLDLLTEAGSGPSRLNVSDVKVPPGGRLRIPLMDKVDATSVVLLHSSSPVVAERVAYSSSVGDVAALIGIPIE